MDHGQSQCTRTPIVLLLKQNKCVNWKKGALVVMAVLNQ